MACSKGQAEAEVFNLTSWFCLERVLSFSLSWEAERMLYSLHVGAFVFDWEWVTFWVNLMEELLLLFVEKNLQLVFTGSEMLQMKYLWLSAWTYHLMDTWPGRAVVFQPSHQPPGVISTLLVYLGWKRPSAHLKCRMTRQIFVCSLFCASFGK